MNEKEFELFKKMWLDKFRGYYKKGRVDKNKLKKSIDDNPRLLESQKSIFWKLVIK